MAPGQAGRLRSGHPATRAALNWTPTGPGLLADLDAGHYFEWVQSPSAR